MPEPQHPVPPSEFVLCLGAAGRTRIQVWRQGGAVWLAQRLVTELDQTTVPARRQLKEALAHDTFDNMTEQRKEKM